MFFLFLSLSKRQWRSFVSCWPVKNLTELANGPTLYTRWQGQGTAFFYRQSAITILVPLTRSDNFIGQKRTNNVGLMNLPSVDVILKMSWILCSKDFTVTEGNLVPYKFLLHCLDHGYLHSCRWLLPVKFRVHDSPMKPFDSMAFM
jgi:hypothetical protein